LEELAMKLSLHTATAMGMGDCAPICDIHVHDDGSEGWSYRMSASAAASLGIEAASLKAPGELFRVVMQAALP
jgi:hypothetical protein